LLRRRPEIDFDAEPLHGLNDAGVLDLAAREDRLLVTHDVSTIPPLFYSLYGKVDLPGVILVPQNFPIGSTIERLDQIWQVARAEDWRGRLCYLPSVSDFMA
jgi:hypothetical protein